MKFYSPEVILKANMRTHLFIRADAVSFIVYGGAGDDVFLLHFCRLPVAFTHFHHPLHLCDLGFHLCDEHLELFLALLAGSGVDIAGVLFAVRPLGE